MDELIVRVREVLSTTPERWRLISVSVDLGLLERRPAPGEWSAVECLRHLLTGEVGTFSRRLQAFLEGRDLAPSGRDANGSRPEPTTDPTILAARFADARMRSLTSLAALTEADLERTARHPRLGRVTLGEMLNQWAAHDLMHTVQGERALMQPFIVASGPWRGHFADHDAGAVGS
jgi:hypothetical protein